MCRKPRTVLMFLRSCSTSIEAICCYSPWHCKRSFSTKCSSEMGHSLIWSWLCWGSLKVSLQRLLHDMGLLGLAILHAAFEIHLIQLLYQLNRQVDREHRTFVGACGCIRFLTLQQEDVSTLTAQTFACHLTTPQQDRGRHQ